MKSISTLLLTISMFGIVHAQNVGVGTSSPSSRFEIKGIQDEKIFDARDHNEESKLIIDKDGNVGIGEPNPLTKLHINSTDAVIMPKGTSLERPASPQEGSTRYNSDSKALEYYDGTQWVSTNTEQVSVGTIAPYGGVTPPAGWLVCNGSAVSRITYAELFAVLGTTYGAGDGSTTFNLPDLSGKAAFGLSTSAPFNVLGGTGGSTSTTPTLTPNLAVDIAPFNTALPDHTHVVPAHSHGHTLTTVANSTSSDGAHTHTINDPGHSHAIRTNHRSNGSLLNIGDSGVSNTNGNNTDACFNATTGITINSGGAHTHPIPALSVTGTVGTGTSGNVAFESGNPTSNPNIAIDPPSTAVIGTVTSSDINTTNPYQVVNYIIKADNTASSNVVAVNIATGTEGQTLYNNGSAWTPTSNLYNSGTNVGVGTTNPAATLSVAGSIGVSESGGTGNRLQISSSGSGAEIFQNDNSPIIFKTQSGTQEKMRIADNGNVGIGTASPGSKVEINAGANNGLRINNGTVNGVVFNTSNTSMTVGTVSNHPLSLYTNNAPRLSISETGGVIIGSLGAGYVKSDGSGNLTSGGISVGDIPVLNQNTTGNAATATNVSYAGVTNIPTSNTYNSSNPHRGFVANQLSWNNYGNNHTIFDASAGLSPSGTAVSQTNAAIAWAASYPTLMGWNGSSTYGVRVDMARWAQGINITDVTVNAGGGYFHLGDWGSAWNMGNGVLVKGAHMWWGVSPSDRKFKQNITPLANAEIKSLSNDLLNVPLYRYQYINDPMGDGLNHIGMLADEAPAQMQINGKESINIIEGFMMAVASLKVLKQEKDELEKRVKILEAQMNKINETKK